MSKQKNQYFKILVKVIWYAVVALISLAGACWGIGKFIEIISK